MTWKKIRNKGVKRDMEKKSNIWVGGNSSDRLIIVSIGSYYVFPSVKHVMNQGI